MANNIRSIEVATALTSALFIANGGGSADTLATAFNHKYIIHIHMSSLSYLSASIIDVRNQRGVYFGFGNSLNNAASTYGPSSSLDVPTGRGSAVYNFSNKTIDVSAIYGAGGYDRIYAVD